MKVFSSILVVTVLVGHSLVALAQGGGGRGGGHIRSARELPLPGVVQTQAELSVVLGCPTDTSVTLNVLSASDASAAVEYGETATALTHKLASLALTASTPWEMQIKGLKPDKQYFYRLSIAKRGETGVFDVREGTIHTQRALGQAFTFALQGDSHPERPQQFDSSLYLQTLAAVSLDRPDFYLLLGDDFSVDTLRTVNSSEVQRVYLFQRAFLGQLAQSVPLFLVNGNHEQASAANLDGTPDNVAVWAQTARNSLFALPDTGGIYTGDAEPVPHIGLLRDYYAWTWGDALFVVIDPYWHSSKAVDNPYGGGEKPRNLWESMLGDSQYKWLAKTLESSNAKYKFVFNHHILGTGRGGIEEVPLFEWGGRDKNGQDLFASKRPGWAMPLHQLFVKNGVSVVFQGHDHIFAHQELDGVTYQTLAEPADPNYASYNFEAYQRGDKRPNSGYVRVKVAADSATVEYVRQYLPKDENATQHSGDVAFSYSVAPRGSKP
ncbi:MAG TPA: metallophosphoesterase [Capsulimonadaceae bacterium]|jgi:hypothetical protein